MSKKPARKKEHGIFIFCIIKRLRHGVITLPTRSEQIEGWLAGRSFRSVRTKRFRSVRTKRCEGNFSRLLCCTSLSILIILFFENLVAFFLLRWRKRCLWGNHQRHQLLTLDIFIPSGVTVSRLVASRNLSAIVLSQFLHPMLLTHLYSRKPTSRLTIHASHQSRCSWLLLFQTLLYISRTTGFQPVWVLVPTEWIYV